MKQSKSANSHRPSNPANKPLGIYVAMAVGIAVVSIGLWWSVSHARKKAEPKFSPAAGQTDQALYATYGGSQSCRDCHVEAYEAWKSSHHALAERRLDPVLDRPAFDPPRTLKHGTQQSEMRVDPNFQFVVVTMSTNGERRSFPVERVIGVDPLRQYLVAAPGGRLQCTEIASDPNKGDWFDVFGDENRITGEWGHWTGRGMTWNFMCASCHNTRLRKNYDESTDTYKTAMAEMGVGCEACHGPMGKHVAWQRKYARKGDPTIEKFSRDQYRDNCGTCHARRAELTGDYRPGDLFEDHFSLTVPDETDIFYPDGQIRDEDYEYTSFLGSRMHAGGVRCFNCHEPHSAKTRGKGNVLCMTCHISGGTTMTNSPIIDPLAHGHHPMDKPGSGCLDCHMPQTPYMQRHLRRDHGFTIPDPLLTKQYKIPNACNRCHNDKDVDWSIEWVEKWYGPRMARPTRTRAQIAAQAHAGQQAAVPGLLSLLQTEQRYPLWRAVATGFLKRWSYQPEVTKRLLGQVGDPDPMVRAFTARALELVAPSHPSVSQTLQRLLQDPVRMVRIEAAWALRGTVDTNSLAGQDLLQYMAQNSDQPSGVLQKGVFLLDRGDTDRALAHFRRAVEWDPNSAPLHHALAVGLSLQGKTDEAIASLETACRLAPREAEYRFKLGLAYNEANRLKAAVSALEQAVKLEPEYSQAWYNLGLAYSSSDQSEQAVSALLKAEALDATSARIPYARATILARLGRVNEAKLALSRALELQPAFPEAAQLLQMLSQNPN